MKVQDEIRMNWESWRPNLNLSAAFNISGHTKLTDRLQNWFGISDIFSPIILVKEEKKNSELKLRLSSASLTCEQHCFPRICYPRTVSKTICIISMQMIYSCNLLLIQTTLRDSPTLITGINDWTSSNLLFLNPGKTDVLLPPRQQIIYLEPCCHF